MADFQRHIETLRMMFDGHKSALEEMERARARFSEGAWDEARDRMESDIVRRAEEIERYLKRHLLRFPFYHERHFEKLAEFHKAGKYRQSVFIMTKFPEGNEEPAQRLTEIINLVRSEIADRRFIPRLASDKRYHPMLWDNVELHALACCRGIAIVEDRYEGGLNPNVAMEWGWMRAMGKPVLFLMEQTFQHQRADWQGLLQEQFSWEDPAATVRDAVGRWFETTSEEE